MMNTQLLSLLNFISYAHAPENFFEAFTSCFILTFILSALIKFLILDRKYKLKRLVSFKFFLYVGLLEIVLFYGINALSILQEFRFMPLSYWELWITPYVLFKIPALLAFLLTYFALNVWFTSYLWRKSLIEKAGKWAVIFTIYLPVVFIISSTVVAGVYFLYISLKS